MYRVIKAFADLQDVKKTKSGDLYHEYEIGDEYPRKGLKQIGRASCRERV